MKKFITLLITLFVMTGLFTGCGVKTGESAAKTLQDNTIADIYPLTIKDANGFEMSIEKEPVNIISLTLGTDEMLLGLIDKSRIKALTKYADDAGISNVAEAAKQITIRVGSEEIEKIISLQPDLVFVDTWGDPKMIKQLRDAKINVYVFDTPNNIAQQRDTVQEIANIVGAKEEGIKIVIWMDEKLKAVEDRLKALKEEDRLTVLDYGEMGSSSGKGTNFDDIVTRAGLVNVVSKAGIELWPTLSKEKIVEMNPDIIILPSWYYDQNISLQGLINTIKNDKSLADVKAVKNDRFLSVPNPHLSAISQYVVLGVEDVAKAAYPDLFK